MHDDPHSRAANNRGRACAAPRTFHNGTVNRGSGHDPRRMTYVGYAEAMRWPSATSVGPVSRPGTADTQVSGKAATRCDLPGNPAHPAPVRAGQRYRLSITRQDEGTAVGLNLFHQSSIDVWQ